MTKILLAEDNFLNMKLMYDILSTQGYVLETASDGQETLAKLKQNDYNLLLLDIQMPIVSGFEVLEEIKKNNMPVKTIVVSACAMEEEINKVKSLGCDNFITKPIRINEFISKVKEVLR